MLKGKTVIELTDVYTGKKEIHEDTNMVTEAVSDVLNTNIMGLLYNNTSFNNSSGENWMLPIKKNIMGGILLYQNPLEDKTNNLYAPFTNPLIGYASDDANNTEDIRRGSRNLTESKIIDNGFRFVWDFATSQANGTISALCLTNTLAGKGTRYESNYMVRLGSWSTNVNNIYKKYLERDNKRIFIDDGYRLEMTTFYNSDIRLQPVPFVAFVLNAMKDWYWAFSSMESFSLQKLNAASIRLRQSMPSSSVSWHLLMASRIAQAFKLLSRI